MFVVLAGVAAIVLVVAVVFLLRGTAPAPAEQPVAEETEHAVPPPAPAPPSQVEVIDTSDWQTYRNDEFGFEMRYPSDWFNATDEGYAGRYAFSNKASGFNGKDVENVELRIDSPPGGEQLFSALQGIKVGDQLILPLNQPTIYRIIYTKIQDFTVGGYPAVRYKVKAQHQYQDKYIQEPDFGPVTGDFVLINRDGYSTQFVFNGGSQEAVNRYQYTFDQILSTFRFWEPQIDTSNWQTYRSEMYGFEYKHPLDWTFGGSPSAVTGGKGFYRLQINWFDSNERDLSFCEDYLTSIRPIALNETSRCERLTVDGMSGVIDWDVTGAWVEALFDDGSSSLSVRIGDSAMLGGYYDPYNQALFKTFLSTLRFFESQEATILASCRSGRPTITSISPDSGPIGTEVEIRGCNFVGFEGDLNAWIENGQGVSGILYGKEGSTYKFIKVILGSPLCQSDNSYSGLPCKEWLTLTSGAYKIYVAAWQKTSIGVNFTITQ